MNLDDWLSDKFDEERDELTWRDIWDAAVDTTINALVEAGNLDNHYRPEWTKTAKEVKS